VPSHLSVDERHSFASTRRFGFICGLLDYARFSCRPFLRLGPACNRGQRAFGLCSGAPQTVTGVIRLLTGSSYGPEDFRRLLYDSLYRALLKSPEPSVRPAITCRSLGSVIYSSAYLSVVQAKLAHDLLANANCRLRSCDILGGVAQQSDHGRLALTYLLRPARVRKATSVRLASEVSHPPYVARRRLTCLLGSL